MGACKKREPVRRGSLLEKGAVRKGTCQKWEPVRKNRPEAKFDASRLVSTRYEKGQNLPGIPEVAMSFRSRQW